MVIWSTVWCLIDSDVYGDMKYSLIDSDVYGDMKYSLMFDW